MEKKYFFAEKGTKYGPFSFEEIKDKGLTKSTLVWTNGMNDWDHAENLNELKDYLIPEPPPLPFNDFPDTSTLIKKRGKNFSLKYDQEYKKETIATKIGILLLISSIIYSLVLRNQYETSNDLFYLDQPMNIVFDIIIRIIVTKWVVKISSRQNRDTVTWGWFSFFFPSLALIIIGQLKKLRV